MSQITFENEFNLQQLKELNKIGFPDCNMIPMAQDEIKDLKFGDYCYVISRTNLPRLMVFLGVSEGNQILDDEFRFCYRKEEYDYKVKNAGKTYNVFRAYAERRSSNAKEI